MNIVEKMVNKRIKKAAWRRTLVGDDIEQKILRQKIQQYRWVIKDTSDTLIYDSDKNGYDGLNSFPIIFEVLEKITEAEKRESKDIFKFSKKEKPRINYVLDARLQSIFPNCNLERTCLEQFS